MIISIFKNFVSNFVREEDRAGAREAIEVASRPRAGIREDEPITEFLNFE